MVHQVLITIIIAEVLSYLVISTNMSLRERLARKGVSVYPFMYLIDLGKIPKFKVKSKFSNVLSLLLLVFGVANFVFLLYIFYQTLLPYVIMLIKGLVVGAQVSSPFIPIVPGITVSVNQFIYIILALSIGVALHEIFHAFAAYLNGWRVESWGIGLFLIFPLAYVRPSEEDYKKSGIKSKAIVLSAGVLANTILFLIAMALMPVAFASIQTAVVIVSVERNATAPAFKAGIPYPSIIVSVNNSKVSSIDDLRNMLMKYRNISVTYVMGIMKAEIVGDVVKPTSNISYYIVHKPKGRWRLGIIISEMPLATTSPLTIALARFLYWFYVVNISLAIINAAPLYVTDGGKLISEVLSRVKLNLLNHLVQGLTAAFVAIFLLIGLMRFI